MEYYTNICTCCGGGKKSPLLMKTKGKDSLQQVNPNFIPQGSQVVLNYKGKILQGNKTQHRVLALLARTGYSGLMNINMHPMGYGSLDLSDYVYKIRHNLGVTVHDVWVDTGQGKRKIEY